MLAPSLVRRSARHPSRAAATHTQGAAATPRWCDGSHPPVVHVRAVRAILHQPARVPFPKLRHGGDAVLVLVELQVYVVVLPWEQGMSRSVRVGGAVRCVGWLRSVATICTAAGTPASSPCLPVPEGALEPTSLLRLWGTAWHTWSKVRARLCVVLLGPPWAVQHCVWAPSPFQPHATAAAVGSLSPHSPAAPIPPPPTSAPSQPCPTQQPHRGEMPQWWKKIRVPVLPRLLGINLGESKWFRMVSPPRPLARPAR